MNICVGLGRVILKSETAFFLKTDQNHDILYLGLEIMPNFIFGHNSLIWSDITISMKIPCSLLQGESNEGSHDPGDIDHGIQKFIFGHNSLI